MTKTITINYWQILSQLLKQINKKLDRQSNINLKLLKYQLKINRHQ